MVTLRQMLLVLTSLVMPVARGQEGGTIANTLKNFGAQSSEAKPNKVPEVQGLTLTDHQASLVGVLRENRSTKLFKDVKVSALQEQASHSNILSAFLKSNSVSRPSGTAPNGIQMKNILGLGPISWDARLMDSVRNSNSRWKALLPSDLDKK